jgi:hypothetical protein
VLELDLFKGHLVLDVRSLIYAMNTDLVVVPGGLTSHLHIVVNKHFEDHLKQLYSEWLLVGDQFLTNSYANEPRSWQQISPEIIVKGCKNYCMSHEIDGKEDKEEVWNVSSECATDGGNCEGTEVETVHRVGDQSETGKAAERRPVNSRRKLSHLMSYAGCPRRKDQYSGRSWYQSF